MMLQQPDHEMNEENPVAVLSQAQPEESKLQQ